METNKIAGPQGKEVHDEKEDQYVIFEVFDDEFKDVNLIMYWGQALFTSNNTLMPCWANNDEPVCSHLVHDYRRTRTHGVVTEKDMGWKNEPMDERDFIEWGTMIDNDKLPECMLETLSWAASKHTVASFESSVSRPMNIFYDDDFDLVYTGAPPNPPPAPYVSCPALSAAEPKYDWPNYEPEGDESYGMIRCTGGRNAFLRSYKSTDMSSDEEFHISNISIPMSMNFENTLTYTVEYVLDDPPPTRLDNGTQVPLYDTDPTLAILILRNTSGVTVYTVDFCFEPDKASSLKEQQVVFDPPISVKGLKTLWVED